jgi:hypothetical protein
VLFSSHLVHIQSSVRGQVCVLEFLFSTLFVSCFVCYFIFKSSNFIVISSDLSRSNVTLSSRNSKLPHMQLFACAPELCSLLIRRSSPHLGNLLESAFAEAAVSPAMFSIGSTTNSYLLNLESHYDRTIAMFLLELNRLLRRRLRFHKYERPARSDRNLYCYV